MKTRHTSTAYCHMHNVLGVTDKWAKKFEGILTCSAQAGITDIMQPASSRQRCSFALCQGVCRHIQNVATSRPNFKRKWQRWLLRRWRASLVVVFSGRVAGGGGGAGGKLVRSFIYKQKASQGRRCLFCCRGYMMY